MAQAASQHKEVEFVYHWSLKMSDVFNSALPDPIDDLQYIISPIFQTQHNDLAFDWRLGVDKHSLTVYLILDAARKGTKKISVTWCVSLEQNATTLTKSAFSPNIWGEPGNFVRYNKSYAAAKTVNGVISFHLHLKIDEAEFKSRGMNIREGGRVVEIIPGPDKSQTMGFLSCNLFDKILVGKKLDPNEGAKQPDADIHQKKLDFQIHTSDGCVIWCHSLVLVSGNVKFATLIGAGLKETEQSTIKVKFGSDAMMEVLHLIYKRVVLGKFQDPDLEEIVDAANDYDLPKLKQACEERLHKMCEELDGETGAQVLVLGDRYGMAGIKAKALEWAIKNPAKIAKSDAGKGMRQDLFMEILEMIEAKQ